MSKPSFWSFELGDALLLDFDEGVRLLYFTRFISNLHWKSRPVNSAVTSLLLVVLFWFERIHRKAVQGTERFVSCYPLHVSKFSNRTHSWSLERQYELPVCNHLLTMLGFITILLLVEIAVKEYAFTLMEHFVRRREREAEIEGDHFYI